MADIEQGDFNSTLAKGTTPSTTSNAVQNKNLESTILDAMAEPGGLTTGKALRILDEALPADRKVVVQPVTSDSSGKVEAPLSKVYTVLDYNKDVVISEQVTTEGIFPSAVGVISDGAFYTSSNQTSTSQEYYYTVADGGTTSSNDLFDVAFGNMSSSNSWSQANYRQYANVLLNTDIDYFAFSSSLNVHEVFIMSFKRTRYKERLDPGNWVVKLAYSSSVAAFNGTASLSDDSADGATTTKTSVGDRVNIVSGTIGSVVETDVRGWAYPDMGLLIFDAAHISASYGISSSLQFIDALDTVQARNERRLKDMNFFCRVFNKEFNYSNNPTFVTGSAGDYRFSSFSTNPKVYITTIGLYNDSNELVATARLSKPSEKTFSKESIFTIKLSW